MICRVWLKDILNVISQLKKARCQNRQNLCKLILREVNIIRIYLYIYIMYMVHQYIQHIHGV